MASNNFPEDLILDILTMLPVNSLLRFRCVSKLWFALIRDPGFIKMHLTRSLATNTNLSLISIKSSNFYLYSLDFEDCKQETLELNHPLKFPRHGTELVGSCNGLLCISNYRYRNIFLWNPSTRRYKKLPYIPTETPFNRLPPHLAAYGFGYEPITEDYKLVKVVSFYDIDDNSIRLNLNIYSLITNSWRGIGDMPFVIFENPNGVYADSTIHWIVKRWKENFMISFDLKDEEYREVSLPACTVKDKFGMNLGVLGGQLCVLYDFSIRVEIWMLKNYGVRDSWAKLFSIEESIMREPFRFLKPICYSKHGGVLLQNYSESLVVYDPHTGRVSYCRISGVSKLLEAEVCADSLIALNAK
ncbi:F-box protein CPR1-like [Macadamia integrifolia]|uniref:F-box protein CPR1-like n=1 Tax=Macadamia integrifolia TaxID=60698 RepID=UPI001C4F83C7|nr:F-box protein CPR1-like [Macadamia integrifolia]